MMNFQGGRYCLVLEPLKDQRGFCYVRDRWGGGGRGKKMKLGRHMVHHKIIEQNS